MSDSGMDKHVSRRQVVALGAWSVPAVLATGALPAFAAASPGANPAVGYMALIDTQGANTIQENTDGSTWPHGVLSDDNPSLKTVKFQLGMQMGMYNGAMYDDYTYEEYKNWVSGPITVQLTFDRTVYSLISNQATWTDAPDNGGTAWIWSSTSTVADWTTLTFTHAQIAANGNTLGIPTQTGEFTLFFDLLKNPGVQDAPEEQPAEGRTVTNSMKVQVDSGLISGVQIPYVQEDSSQLFN